jgi:ferrous iron transport protein B
MHQNKLNNILLVGKPNAGKTSLFNQLTGLNQKVGNYSGVTIEVLKGKTDGTDVIDIPGLQSLNTSSPEEIISKGEIIKAAQKQQTIVFVANAMQLFDSLVLFSQIADLQTPMILVINFIDEAKRNKLEIDKEGLEKQLGCPIVLLNSRKGEGVDKLKELIAHGNSQIPNTICRSNYEEFKNGQFENNYIDFLQAKTQKENWESDYNRRQKILLPIINSNVQTENDEQYLANTHKWDNILLHPIWGLLIFFITLYLVFQSVFFFSSFPMEWIDSAFAELASFAENRITTPWLQNLVSNAIIPGLSGVLIFIPQIAILFFLIGILEQVGYLSRISFISDAFLKKFGLSGHSVVPLVSSWACAIPAIMSTRIIENPKERLTAILTLPLMTCSARLPVYVILIAVLFPTDTGTFFGMQGLFLMLLYLLGVIATLVLAFIINKYSQAPSNPNWVLELPVFRKPNWKSIFINVYNKTKTFVVQAGKIIFLVALALWFLANWSPKSDKFLADQSSKFPNQTIESIKLEYSYLGYTGKFIEPAIKPLGYDWKIGIALISSFAAREVFVGTLSSIYSIENNDEKTIVDRLRSEKTPDGDNRYGWGTSLSLLLFYVFAMQCMSTLAVVKKETGQWKYVVFQFTYMLVLAYGSAFIAYQLLA